MQVQLLLYNSGFHDGPVFLSIDLQHFVEVFRHVDNDDIANGLSGQAGSDTSRENRYLEVAGHFHRGENVFMRAWNHDADGFYFVNAGIRAVEKARGFIEADFTGNSLL